MIFLVKSQSAGVHYWKTVRRNRKKLLVLIPELVWLLLWSLNTIY